VGLAVADVLERRGGRRAGQLSPAAVAVEAELLHRDGHVGHEHAVAERDPREHQREVQVDDPYREAGDDGPETPDLEHGAH
jgi:hypothetical protein